MLGYFLKNKGSLFALIMCLIVATAVCFQGDWGSWIQYACLAVFATVIFFLFRENYLLNKKYGKK